MARNDTTMGGPAVGFPDTVWTLILSARGEGQEASQRLNELIRTYWKPVYCYLRRGGRSNDEAKDLAQDFLSRLLERDFLRELSPEKGSFRGFLKTSLRRFLIDDERTKHRQKRGGEAATLSLDFETAEEALSDGGESTPEAAFDREWTRSLVATAVDRLEKRLEAEGRRVRFEVFQAYDLEGATGSYGELAKRLRLTEAEVRHHLSHAREAFRQIVRGLVAAYVATEDELRGELRELFGE